MADWYVNADTGNDTTGDGSSGLPYADVPKAISVASSGDTIYLQDAVATYTFAAESFTGLTFIGELIGTRTARTGNISGCAIDGGNAQDQAINWQFDGTVTFNTLRFTNISSGTGSSNVPTFGWSKDNADTTLTVTNCFFDSIRISHNGSRGGLFSAQNLVTGTQTVIALFSGCVFDDILRASAASNSVLIGDRNCNTSSFIRAYNCIFYSATDSGEFLDNIFRDQGGEATFDVKNCIINNTVSTMQNVFANEPKAGSELDYCCTYDSTYITLGGTFTNPNGTTSDPLIIDPANDKFRLRPTSPCRGTGVIV